MSSTKLIIGWRERLALPELGIPLIKAKIDTGARSSALHAFYIDPYSRGGQRWVMFALHPKRNAEAVIECHAPLKDRRIVSDSGGHKQRRYVIESLVVLGRFRINAEITLTNRDNMMFRMLLGRTATADHFLIDPNASYLQGKPVTADRTAP